MQLYSPLSTTPRRKAVRAPALPKIEGLRIGILENGKLNAEEMLNEVAALFVQRHELVQHLLGIELAVLENADPQALDLGQGRSAHRLAPGRGGERRVELHRTLTNSGKTGERGWRCAA